MTLIGYSAGVALTSGTSNTFVGSSAGQAAQTATKNVFVGDSAGVVNVSGFQNTLIGSSAGHALTGSNCTMVGYTAGNLVTGNSNTIIGNQVASTTLTTGTSNILIGTSSACDTPATSTASMLNIQNSIAGVLAGGTNPRISAVGMPSIIGVLKSANFNVTTDQAITIDPLTTTSAGYLSSATKYVITDIRVMNGSISLTTAQGGFYTAASKGGTIIGATTTAYTACTGATTVQKLSAVTNMDTNTFTAATLYLSLTTAQGSAATADVYVFGYPIN